MSKEPTTKFRGSFIPAEIFHLLEDGTINPTEFALLAVIDSLVDARGVGCWASNSYLAKRVNVHIDRLRDILQKLKKMGLVIEVGYFLMEGLKRRTLETPWSRVDISKVGVGAGAHLNGCTTGAGAQGAGAHQNDTPTEYLNREDKKVEARAASPTRATTPEATLLPVGDAASARKKPEIPEHCQLWAKRLRQALMKKKEKTDIGASSQLVWADCFRLLWEGLDRDTHRVESVLAWYEQNIDMMDRPSIRDAKQFRQHFGWIEDNKRNQERPRQQTAQEREDRNIF